MTYDSSSITPDGTEDTRGEDIASSPVNPEFAVPPPPDVVAELQSVRRPISFGILDPDAVKIVRRLKKYGFDAFLVGGCVRDILLGLRPKDFDIATSARPAEVRNVFRNCRLIGRRFRLAHLHFANQKIIEVATFRRNATESDDVSERHAAENLFGNPADDAVRRDFTINALMYDVSRQLIHDWAGGMSDIEARLLRTIGNPDRRMVEDPVRIIRAVKFGIRLDLQFEPSLLEAMRTHAPLIAKCSPARLIEEMFKILRCGHAVECLRMLSDLDAMAYILPAVHVAMKAAGGDVYFWRALERADAMIRRDRSVSDAVLLSALLYPACLHAIASDGDVSRELETVLRPLVHPLPFTKRHMAIVRQLFVARRRLSVGPTHKRSRRILERDFGAEAVDLLELTAATAEEEAALRAWRALQAGRPLDTAADAKNPEGGEKTKRRRRRRRGPKPVEGASGDSQTP